MKLSFYICLLTLTAVASSTLPASAQGESRAGNRFNFAPNTWKQESAPARHAAPDPVHAVKSGMVPAGNPLGLDPILLAKPAPPPISLPALPPRQATPTVTATAHVPSTTFNPNFGRPMVTAPLSAIPQKMANLPVLPMQAAPLMAKPAVAPVAVAHHSSSGLSGKLLTRPRRRTVTPMAATPQVANYGGQGYDAGAYLPSASSGGGANASLSGRILTKTRHH